MGISDASSAWITPEEAVTQLGCELYEKDGDTVLVSPFQTARLIVQSKDEIDLQGASEIADGYQDLHILQYASPAAAYAAYQNYQKDAHISFVTADRIYRADGTAQGADLLSSNGAIPKDEYAWGVSAIGADAYCDWLQSQNTELPEVVVAVIDTGVYAEHSWLEGRILTDKAMGFIENSDGSWNDGQGHGTHCSGIIRQSTPDNVKILPIKSLNDRGTGTSLEVYCGMMYAVEQGVDIISMRLGGPGDDPLITAGCRAAEAAGIPCCVSAGNDSKDSYYYLPAADSYCVTVSSLSASWDGEYYLSDFSNYGSAIDFAAPGRDINSAVCTGPDDTEQWSGTSMATPFVSAAFANLLSYDPSLTLTQMYDYLKANALDLGEPGFDTQYGWGMIDLSDFRFSDVRCAQPILTIDGDTYNNVYYDDAVELALITEESDAEIYYTLDGSTPSKENGILYTKPFMLEQTATIRAITVTADAFSRTISATFCIADADIENPYTIENGVLTGYHGILRTLDLSTEFTDGSLKAIGENAFVNSPVTELILPDSVTEIGNRAFYYSELRTLIAPGVTAVGEEALAFNALENLSLGKLKKLGAGAFINAGSLNGLALDVSVTEIPDKAFMNCKGLNDFVCDWSKITKIGESAFQNTDVADSISLPKLESLGESAFENTDSLEALILPDSITALPAGVLCGASGLEHLSAPGVTEIGAQALCLSWGEGNPISTDIDFTQVTAIGEEGMARYRFDGPVTFSSLTDIGAYAFAFSHGAAITLPAITELNSITIGETQCSVKLPNVEHIYMDDSIITSPYFGYAGYRTHGIIVGDALNEIEDDALGNGSYLSYADYYCCPDFLAGPVDSILKDYAKKYNITYLTVPTLFQAESEYTVRQFYSETLYAEIVDAPDCTLQWYRVDAGKEILIPNETGQYYTFFAEEPGEHIIRAVLTNGSKRVDSVDYTILVQGAAQIFTSNDLCNDGETLLINWNEMPAEHRDQLTEENTGLYCAYAFTPETTGAYFIGKDSCSGFDAELILNDEDYSIESIGWADAPITLDAGNTYYIIMRRWFGEDLSPLTYPHCVLRISQTDFAERKRLSYSAHSISKEQDIMVDLDGNILNDPGFTCTFSSTDEETEETVDTILTENQDYLLYYGYNDSAREGRKVWAYAIGIGDYYGGFDTSEFSNYYLNGGDLTAESVVDIPEDERQRAICFRFVPEESGFYTIFTTPDEDALQEQLDSGQYDPSFAWNSYTWWNDTCVFSDSMEQLTWSSSNGCGAYIRIEMTAGNTYYVCVYETGKLHLTQNDNVVNYSWVTQENQYYQMTADASVQPEISVYSPSGVK